MGLVIGLLRWPFRGFSWSFTMKAASYGTALLTGGEVAGHHLTLERLKQAGVKVDLKSRRLVNNFGAVEADDIVFGAAALGALIALSPRMFVGSTGWTRYFGAAAVGTVVTEPTLHFIFGQDLLRAVSKEKTKRQKQRIEWFQNHRGNPVYVGWYKGLGTDGPQSIKAESDKTFESTLTHDAAINEDGRRTDTPAVGGASSQSSGEDSHHTHEEPGTKLTQRLHRQLKSVRKPHMVVIEDGKEVFVPVMDLTWMSSSMEEYQSIFENHIRELSDRKAYLTQTADYLWATIMKKQIEIQTPRLTQAELAQIGNNFLYLNDLHLRAYTEIAFVTWMIARSVRDLQDNKYLMSQPREVGVAPGNHPLQKYGQERQAQIISEVWKTKEQRVTSVQSAIEWMRQKAEEIQRTLNGKGQQTAETKESTKMARTTQLTPGDAEPNAAVPKEAQVIDMLSRKAGLLEQNIKEAEAELASLKSSSD